MILGQSLLTYLRANTFGPYSDVDAMPFICYVVKRSKDVN